jgi:hypothetical protein
MPKTGVTDGKAANSGDRIAVFSILYLNISNVAGPPISIEATDRSLHTIGTVFDEGPIVDTYHRCLRPMALDPCG